MGWSEGSGSSGQGWDYCYADRLALDVMHLYRNKKEGGSVGASPVAAPMPKSVPGLMREKIDCLEGECVAYVFV